MSFYRCVLGNGIESEATPLSTTYKSRNLIAQATSKLFAAHLGNNRIYLLIYELFIQREMHRIGKTHNHLRFNLFDD